MRKKTFLGLLAVLIVGGLVLAVAIGSSWFTNKNIKTWFNHWGQKPEENKPTTAVVAVSDTGEAMYAGCTYAMPEAMTVTQDTTFEPTGEFILTAETSNEYVNGTFEWSAAWVNASSEWATGRNVYDYCEMTAATDGSGGAKFKVISSFAEQIAISAKLTGTDAVDSCTVDYLKRAEVNGYCLCFSDFDETFELEIDYSLGIGTVTGEFSLLNVYLGLDYGFEEDFKSILKFDVKTKPFNPLSSGYQYETSYNGYNGKNYGYFTFNNHNAEYSDFIEDFDTFSEAKKQAVYYAWYTAFVNYIQHDSMRRNLLLDIQVGYSYNGVGAGGFTENDFPVDCLSGGEYFDKVDIDVVLKGGYVV